MNFTEKYFNKYFTTKYNTEVTLDHQEEQFIYHLTKIRQYADKHKQYYIDLVQREVNIVQRG